MRSDFSFKHKFWFSHESNSRLPHKQVGIRGYLQDHSGDELVYVGMVVRPGKVFVAT